MIRVQAELGFLPDSPAPEPRHVTTMLLHPSDRLWGLNKCTSNGQIKMDGCMRRQQSGALRPPVRVGCSVGDQLYVAMTLEHSECQRSLRDAAHPFCRLLQPLPPLEGDVFSLEGVIIGIYRVSYS